MTWIFWEKEATELNLCNAALFSDKGCVQGISFDNVMYNREICHQYLRKQIHNINQKQERIPSVICKGIKI